MKNLRLKQLLLVFAILIVTNSHSQVEVTNNCDLPITVAIAYYKSTKSYSGWVSEGWWSLEPGETKTLGSFLKNGENTYYIHAHTAGYANVWGNDEQLAVNSTDAFTIKNCDKEYVLGDDVITKGFTKKFVHIGLLEMYRAYVSFSCN